MRKVKNKCTYKYGLIIKRNSDFLRNTNNTKKSIQSILGKEGKHGVINRMNRYKETFFKTLQEKGLSLDDMTVHILGGEYQKRCVDNYAINLLIYGVKEANIHIFPDICLVSPQDLKKK